MNGSNVSAYEINFCLCNMLFRLTLIVKNTMTSKIKPRLVVYHKIRSRILVIKYSNTFLWYFPSKLSKTQTEEVYIKELYEIYHWFTDTIFCFVVEKGSAKLSFFKQWYISISLGALWMTGDRWSCVNCFHMWSVLRMCFFRWGRQNT